MLLGTCLATTAHAASHREAPKIALDPTADITDVYFFRSWEDPSRVVLIMNVIPGQEPSSGPNYFNLDEDVLYVMHLDVDRDGQTDIDYEFRFETEIRHPFDDLPVAYAGVDGVAGLPPGISALDGTGSEGLGLRQRYTVRQVSRKRRGDLGLGTMFAVPSNIGPRTIPDYEALAAQGIYDLSNGGRVFVGQRDETFYIDLGATFDTLDLRHPPVLTAAEDANDGISPFGVDMSRVSTSPHSLSRFPSRHHRRSQRGHRHIRLHEPHPEPAPLGRRWRRLRHGRLRAGGPPGESPGPTS